MYPSKGGTPYGQNSYATQQAYTQQLSAAGYPSGSDAATSQHALAARQALMGASQEVDYRGQVPQYGGAYAAVYGNAALSSSQQAGGASSKESVPSSLHGRASYSSALAEASKFSSGGSSLAMNSDDYLSASNRAYNQKSSSDYAREYAEHQAALEDDTARRYADPVALSRQHQASLLRQQQLVKAQMLSGSDMRQADYHAARGAPIHPGTQELGSYAGRLDVDPRNLPALGVTPYGGQHAGSILGEAPRRNVDNLIYAQGSAAAAYGVGLPPGRDYVSGKGLRGPSLEPDYPGRRGAGPSMFDDRKDDRNAFHRDLEVRDDERRRELFREREKDREREERERDRERERVRERDREREKERERERERERDRVRERRDRDRERERDRKRATAPRRERSPPKSTRDRQGSSLPRDERSSRRITPRRETVHRRHSPVKEKKREYVCKVYPFCLVDVQRDHLSLNKRYPRLSISPDFSKVVFNWPKENLNLSLHTPVSFEHDFIEIEKKNEDKGSIVALDESAKAKGVSTVWNAKVILMSGISTNALEELSSAKSPDRRIIHLNNILKFAILRKDHSYMAIGGPWDATIDGGDPSVDHCSLIPTALRHLKDVTQLDLQKCSNWNPFLEIHYDRVGKDGLFSHKEITVLFLPDLSDCLPSLELWRSQWLAYVKDAAKREKQRVSKQKKSNGNEAVPGEKVREKSEKDNISPKKVKVEDTTINEKADKMDLEGSSIEKKQATKGTDKTNEDKSETKKDVSVQKGKGPILDEKQAEKKVEGVVSLEVPIITTKKPTVKKIVKRKVAGKKTAVEDGTIKPDEKTAAKIEEVEQPKQVVDAQEIESSANPVKTYAKKKITKKVPAGKPSDLQSEKKTELEESTVKEPEVTAAVPETEVKTTGKKKVIRRIIKRKVSGAAEKDATATTQKAGEKDDSSILPRASKGGDTQLEVAEKEKLNDAKTTEDSAVKKENTTETVKKDAKEAKVVEGKGESKSSGDTKKEDSKKDSSGDTKKEDSKKDTKDAKSESKHKSHKDVKQIGIPEEPPRHPGFFLQTKQPIDSKERLRSMSLSLDGLLDYNDKDIEESTFELSLFAESLNEMLQYEMGSRILSFLEKLRSRYVAQKNQRKRQREENLEKERENEKDSTKRQKKSVGAPGENELVKSENQDTSSMKNEDKMDEDVCQPAPTESKVETKTEDGNVEEEEEDPELLEDGDPEMDEEMDDADSEDADNEDEGTDKITPVAPDKITTEDDKKKEPSEKSNAKDEKNNDKAAISDKKSKKTDDKQSVLEKPVSVEPVVVNKELHQAFKFFDQNQVGYIKVEDLRCIIHNLGKFLSHRDVKEMVQSALFESSSARDNRIFYKKLTSMADII